MFCGLTNISKLSWIEESAGTEWPHKPVPRIMGPLLPVWKTVSQRFRRSENCFFSDLLTIQSTNHRKFWSTFSAKALQNHIQLITDVDDPIKSYQWATTLNNYFSSVFTVTSMYSGKRIAYSCSTVVLDVQITTDDTCKLINSLKIASSAYCDDIISKVLKNTIAVISKILSLIFNKSARFGRSQQLQNRRSWPNF